MTMPTNDDLRDTNGTGYRYYNGLAKKPEFTFGAGLGYTTFQYSNLQLPKAPVAAGAPVTVSIDVTNTDAVAGDEVVQLHLSDKSSKLPMPVK